MFINTAKKLTGLKEKFINPENSTHRQYEALRAYFVDGLSSKEAAIRFGYTAGSFRQICHQFRQNPDRVFFIPPQKGPQASPKKDKLRGKIIAFRKKNFSIYDIHRFLKDEGESISITSISIILTEEGFERLPRRKDEERPPGTKPEAAPIANVKSFSLKPRKFRTKFGGLFLFMPYLAQIPFDSILKRAGFPGSKMIPAGHAMRSLLALKLFGNARHSHVMSYVFDEGMALFPGLNSVPKRSFLTEYSCRIDPASYPKVMKSWFDAVSKLGLERGISFDLDFHTIPFHGEDALVEKHYISKRSRRQKGIMAFLAWDAEKKIFCYANSDIRKENQDDEIINFINFWKKRSGKLPEEVIFDSKLTTYSNLNKINDMEIDFITLRRRSKKMLEEIANKPASSWRRIELENISRKFRTPKILDQLVSIDNYDKPIRQIIITELGHEEPTILITNQLKRPARKLVGRYAKRMIIENAIADGIDFFHMDALSSSVAMKVDCDLQLTLMASSLYKLFASQIGNGYDTAKSRHIFRDFIDATAVIRITDDRIIVRYQKRSHNPYLLAAGFQNLDIPIPWLGNKRLIFEFS